MSLVHLKVGAGPRPLFSKSGLCHQNHLKSLLNADSWSLLNQNLCEGPWELGFLIGFQLAFKYFLLTAYIMPPGSSVNTGGSLDPFLPGLWQELTEKNAAEFRVPSHTVNPYARGKDHS